jgi:hypothetical protein
MRACPSALKSQITSLAHAPEAMRGAAGSHASQGFLVNFSGYVNFSTLSCEKVFEEKWLT